MNIFDFEPEVGEREFLEAQAVYAALAIQDELAEAVRQDEQVAGERWEPFCPEGFLMVEAEAVA